jgi:hypothetical protein
MDKEELLQLTIEKLCEYAEPVIPNSFQYEHYCDRVEKVMRKFIREWDKDENPKA